MRASAAGWIMVLVLAVASLLPAAIQAGGHGDQVAVGPAPVLLHASLESPGDSLPGDELHRQAPAKKRRPAPLLMPAPAPALEDAAWASLAQPERMHSAHRVPAPAADPLPRDRDPVLSLHRGQAPPTA